MFSFFLSFTRLFVSFLIISESPKVEVKNLVLYQNYSRNTLSASTAVSMNMAAFA